MTTSYQDDPYLSAMFAELESLANPFQENLEKLKEVIDRSERDGRRNYRSRKALEEFKANMLRHAMLARGYTAQPSA
jgi:hypothetical protein